MNFTELETLSAIYQDARILHTGVSLDLFSAVGDGASAPQVAADRALNPRATELLLNAMVAIKLLHKADGVFTLTESSRRYLLPDSDAYFGGMVGFEADSWDEWGRLEEAVRSGKPLSTPLGWQDDPQATHDFIMAMHSLTRSRGDDRYLAEHLPLDGVTRLMDVGSGPGTYPIAMCRKHPRLEATIFDLPATLAVTKKVLEQEAMSGRIGLVAGDFNTDPMPGGFDLVFMSNIIHGLDEDHNRALMAKCFQALNPGGRIVIKDHILGEDRTTPVDGAIFSLHMLLATHGRDYALSEVSGWLKNAGFGAVTERPLPAPFSSSLVSAEKPR